MRLPNLFGALLLALAMTAPTTATAAASGDDAFRYEENPAIRSADSDCCRLLLATGEDKVIDLDFRAHAGAAGVAIGNPQLVATTLIRLGEKRQLAIKPLKEGSTTIVLRDEDGQVKLQLYVRILSVNLFKAAAELREILKSVPGIRIRIAGARIVLEGEAANLTDLGKLRAACAPFATWVVNQVALAQKYFDDLARQTESEIRKFAPDARARAVNDQIWLEGKVASAALSERAVQVATLLLPQVLPGNVLEQEPSAQRLPPRSHVQNFLEVRPGP